MEEAFLVEWMLVPGAVTLLVAGTATVATRLVKHRSRRSQSTVEELAKQVEASRAAGIAQGGAWVKKRDGGLSLEG